MKFGGYGKRRPGKSLAFVVSLFICVMMLLFGTEAVLPHAEEPGNQPGETKKQEISDKEEKAKQKWEGDTIYCTALGQYCQRLRRQRTGRFEELHPIHCRLGV